VSLLEQIEEIRLNKVRLYPGNPRRGDVDLIASSLEANGQYRPVVVQRSTGYVLAGNHTVRAARKLGWKSISAVVIDVDDIGAKRIVLADNRTADAGTYDQQALADLLSSLEDLEGTGYADADLAVLLDQEVQANPLPEVGDAPVDDRVMAWGVVVVVGDEAAQADLLTRLAGEGFDVRALVGG
jgi:hypothetical protein